MPYVKFDDPQSFADNKGSCSTFINYLSKEDFQDGISKEFFFDHKEKRILDFAIVDMLDHNKQGLGANDAKFYTGSINFSEKELEFIGNDTKKIRDYTIKVMEQYAAQFNRSVTIDDLNWFAKIEHTRSYKGNDAAVQNGLHCQGEKKEGLQTHVHFIIGRKSKDGKRKLSPKTNHRETTAGPIRGGFDRNSFKQQSEAIFDLMFGYLRPLEESYQYLNSMKNGNLESRMESVTRQASNRALGQQYRSLSNLQKQEKIKKLAHFICYGGKAHSVKQLNVDLLLEVEKGGRYSGAIYRSLVGLNEKMKAGQIPSEYDLTNLVIANANFMESQVTSPSPEEPTKVVSLQNEDASRASLEYLYDSIVHGSAPSNEYEDELEAMRKRKKKRQDLEREL